MEPPELTSPQKTRLEAAGQAFLAEVLEIETRLHPENMEALFELAQVYTRQGRFEAGLEVDRRLVHLVPENPVVHYNLSCSLSLTGEVSGALKALEAAIRLGFRDADHAATDADLEALRDHPRFEELLRLIRA